MNDKKLNQELTDWADRQQAAIPPPDDEWVSNLVSQLDNPLPENEAPPVLHMQRQLRRTRLALAAAVAAVIGLAALLLLPGNTPESPPLASQPPSGLSADDLSELRLVAEEAEQLFPEGIRWISKVNGQISMGVANTRRLHDDATRLAVSYQIRSRGDGQQWATIGRHEIITYADEPVLLEGQIPFELWCHMVTEQRAALSLSAFIEADGTTFELTHDTVQTLGESEVVHRQQVDGKDYEIIQTVYAI